MARRNLIPDQQAALAVELRTDPDGRGYATLGDKHTWHGEVLASLQEQRYPAECRHTMLSLTSGVGDEIGGRFAATMQAVAAIDPLAAELLAIARAGDGLDINNADFRARLEAMAASDNLPLTADDAAAILALADNRASWLDLHGMPTPRIREIREALEAQP